MCANNQTYAAATGISDDRAADAMRRYRAMHQRALRCTLHGDDDKAADYIDKARRIAHIESRRGNFAPILDHIDRQL